MRKTDMLFSLAIIAAALPISACTAESAAGGEGAAAEPAAAASDVGVLSSSTPVNGAKLTAAPDMLVLNFARPVSLAEVVVAGADGMEMPMMLSPAGPTGRYELPLDGIGRGAYTVRWRATDETGAQYQGSIAFEVG